MTGNRIVLLAVAVLVVALSTSLQVAAYALCGLLALAVLVQLVRVARRVWCVWAAARFALAAALIDRVAGQLPPDATDVHIRFASWLGVDDLHMTDREREDHPS